MQMNGARAVVECLKAERADTVFGYPGGMIMHVFDEIFQDDGVRNILTRHEQGAAHAAEGYAKASGRPGVCISTSGPGATNLATGVANAMLDSTPIIAISGQVATGSLGTDAFQEADMFGMMMPITKHNYKVMHSRDIPRVFKQAFHIATTGRPGPVHIDLPKDVQIGKLDFEYPKGVSIRGYRPNYEGHPMQIKQACEMLIHSERPLIMAGGGVIISNASQELTRLAEALMAPVITTLMGKGAIDENHPLCLGMTGMHGRKSANWAVENCDVLLAVGNRFDDRACGKFSEYAPQAKIIHVDIDSAEINKTVRCKLPIQGDAKNVLSQMLAQLSAYSRKQNEWTARVADMRQACECNYESCSQPLRHRAVIGELQKHLACDTTVAVDVGLNQMWAAHHLRVAGPRRFLASGGLGTMGFALPAALGAKAALPQGQAVAFCGDGGFLMTNQELATSTEEALPFIATVMNNGWLGMVKQWQKIYMEGRHSAVNLGKRTDIVKMAQSMGCEAMRAETVSDLKEGFSKAFSKRNRDTFVLDVIIDPDDGAFPMFLPGSAMKVSNMFGECEFSELKSGAPIPLMA